MLLCPQAGNKLACVAERRHLQGNNSGGKGTLFFALLTQQEKSWAPASSCILWEAEGTRGSGGGRSGK